MNGYELSRRWFDFAFENPEKIKPVHSAMYFFIIDHCNRLGWKEKFGLPMEMTKEAIGISNYRTYSKTLRDLINWGFIIEIQKSKNQYSSTIVAIAKNTKANTKATTKALDKATQKQLQKQSQSTVCIDKPLNNITIKPKNKERKKTNTPPPEFLEFKNYALDVAHKKNFEIDLLKLELKYDAWKNNGWVSGKGARIKNWKTTLLNTLPYLQKEKSSAKKEKVMPNFSLMEAEELRKKYYSS